MAENYRQAPRLLHKGEKFISHNEQFWSLPQSLMSEVFWELNGKCGNQIKLMCLLIGTSGKGDFRVSEKWVLDRTGMDETGYKRARKELIQRGWLSHDNRELRVHMDRIRERGVKIAPPSSDKPFDQWED